MDFDPDLAWRDIEGDGFKALIGPVRVADHADGMAMALMLDDRHRNANGVCHGGVLMSVADSGLGVCAFATAGSPVATIDFECDFMAPAPLGERVHGLARVARRARRLLFMEGDLWCAGKRVFRCSGIWAVLDRR